MNIGTTHLTVMAAQRKLGSSGEPLAANWIRPLCGIGAILGGIVVVCGGLLWAATLALEDRNGQAQSAQPESAQAQSVNDFGASSYGGELWLTGFSPLTKKGNYQVVADGTASFEVVNSEIYKNKSDSYAFISDGQLVIVAGNVIIQSK